MIQHKVQSIIKSCKSPDHFAICESWINAVYNEGSEAHKYAMSLLSETREQVARVASKRAIITAKDRFPIDDEYHDKMNSIHQMD